MPGHITIFRVSRKERGLASSMFAFSSGNAIGDGILNTAETPQCGDLNDGLPMLSLLMQAHFLDNFSH